MGTLLHLTDLHLFTGGGVDAVGDYGKSNLVENAGQQSRTRSIRVTLSQLGQTLRDSQTTLDAVVISGDITVQNQPEGYELLPAVLEELGKSLPHADQILISPGNHDVAWSTPPGSTQRYEQLINLRKVTGFRTALLDGIDIDSDGRLMPGAPKPYVVAPDGSFVVLALNSANRSGTVLAATDDVSALLDRLRGRNADDDVELLLRELDKRSLFDVARVDEVQLNAATAALMEARSTSSHHDPMTFVSLHHPLSSVTAVEEMKPFETLTNLGQIRDWVATNKVNGVLHGHKHVASVFEDSHTPSGSSQKHHFAVFGGGTIGLGAPIDGECAQLITVSSASPQHQPLQVQRIHAIQPGQSLRPADLDEHELHLGRQDAHDLGVVRAATIDDVFDVLLGWRASLDSVGKPLVCTVEAGATALSLPVRYPDLPYDVDDPNAWADTLIDWWQSPTRGSAAKFNHGERLKRYEGSPLNQLEEAANTLRNSLSSSRAVAVLVQPRIDLAAQRLDFPSFTLFHAFVTDDQLHVVAYFRKQEIPHWWPINMGELARMQKYLVERVQEEHPRLRSGSITTVTAIPVEGDALPNVSVPWIDLNADHPERLLHLIEPLITRDKEAAAAAWRRVFLGWAEGNSVARDQEPVPVEGFTRATALLLALSSALQSPSNLAVLVEELDQLREINEEYRDRNDVGNRRAARERWVGRVMQKKARILGAIEELSDPAS